MRYSVLVAATLAIFNFVGASPVSNTRVESVEHHSVAKRQPSGEVGVGSGSSGQQLIPVDIGLGVPLNIPVLAPGGQ